MNPRAEIQPNNIKVLVQELASFPKYSTKDSVNELITNVPRVANRFLNIARTLLS